MTFYAVFDTNVLVSSLLTQKEDAATVLVVDAIADGTIIPLYNDEILSEYDEVLHRDKFPFSDERIKDLLSMIEKMGLSVSPSPTGEIFSDMDDLVFYEIVMEKRDKDAYLVTGNIKHFPEKDFIVTPAEMMAIIDKNK